MSQNEIIEDLRSLIVTDEDVAEFKRFDQYLTKSLEDLSRNFIKYLFEDGQITTESKTKLKLNKMPPAGTKIDIQVPPPPPMNAEPENLELPILFEDDHLVIVNKPAGMVTHPAPGNYTGTLVNAILYHCPDLRGVGDAKRPGIVHRLDKGTSGVMVVAKSQKCHEGLVQLFSKHDIDRVYQALCIGTGYTVAGKLEGSIGRHPNNRLKMAVNVKNGRAAVTHYKVLKEYIGCTHMQCKLETGRTHQIRVHMASLLNAFLLCDGTYGNPGQQKDRLPKALAEYLSDYPFPLLHARRLAFVHPITKEFIEFEEEPPEVFLKAIKILEKDCE
ncbi:MAG: RNA pseudouridine synthase [Halobacteriovorax sp.]|nr:RNA pseudouridine synthase [Halobacteriovorax sp.]|tara:strand:- start:1285 stop:2274 length:990 start_codon:yes stop_codon:yes gene_type:complete